MRVPVLVVLPSQEPLQESAMAFQQHRAPSIPITAANVPGPVQLDPTFAAVPVGTGRPQDAFIEALEPKVSQAFAVRGFVEVDSPEEIPSNYDGRPVFSEPQIQAFITCGGSPAMGDTALLKTKLNVPQLGSKGLDGSGVAVVVMDSGINLAHLTSQLGATPLIDVANSWTPPGSSTLPGKHPIDHGTMCAFDVLIAAPKATLLDFPMLAGTAPGGAIVGRTLSVALQAYAYLMANWAVAYAPGGPSKYRALVVTNSWGVYHPSWDFPVAHPGRYCDNPRHPFNLIVTALANSGADIVFAAGNCGAQCADGRCQGRTVETIMGANALDVVLTLAGCDTSDQSLVFVAGTIDLGNAAQ